MRSQSMDRSFPFRSIADLEADRKHLEVRAPHDGVLYYGAAARGSWAGAALVEKKLVPGGKLLAREVFMTVVNPSKLGLQANIGETERNRLRRDVILTGEIKAIPEAMLTAKLKQIGPVPYGNNTFDAFFSIDPPRLLRGDFDGAWAMAHLLLCQ